MKKTFILFLILFLMSAAVGATSCIKIAVSQQKDLVPLIEENVRFLDVRVAKTTLNGTQQYRIKWFPENGFVTIEGNAALAQSLKERGYRIISAGTVPEPPAVAAAGKALPAQFGWPKTMPGWPGVYGQATTIADMNGDGKKEIFLNNIVGYVYGWHANSTFVPSYPRNPYQRFLGMSQGDSVFASWASTGSRETGALGDIDGDGTLDFVFGKDVGYLFAYPYGPDYVPGFPVDLGEAVFSSEPALYDFDQDGKDEIVIASYFWPSGSATYGPADIHIFNDDGTELAGWPQQIPVNSESSPVIGDIDWDYEPEIIVGSGDDPDLNIPGRIYAWNMDGTVCSGFPVDVGYGVESTASLADVDLNGILDILIRIKMESTGVNGIYAFNGQGQILNGFPAVIPRGGTTGAPAVADMDGDGLPEIAIGTVVAVDSGLVYVYNFDGSLKTGFPQLVHRTWVEESVALSDVSGDGLPDVVATTNGTSSKPGMVWAFDYLGNVVNGFPITTESVIGSSLESAPSVLDVDGDGDTELFTANWDGKVFAWDTPGIDTPQNNWPMFKFNAARTGNAVMRPTGIGNSGETVPGEFSLGQNYPNPFNPQTVINFRVPERGAVSLRIFNTLGQEVARVIDHKFYPAGRHEVRFNAAGLASGIYLYRLESGAGVVSRKMMLLK